MNLTSRRVNGADVITLRVDRLDAAASVQFRDAMRQISLKSEGHVLLDLSHVSFLDSSGLGAIVSVWKFLGPDRRLELCGLTPLVARVFRLTRMDDVIRVHADQKSALDELVNAV